MNLPPEQAVSRRLYLRVALKFLGSFAVLMLLWPLVSSLQSGGTTDVVKWAWQPPVSLAGMPVGELKVITLQRPPFEVWVYRRSSQEIAGLNTPNTLLVDVDSQHSQQPVAARNAWRSLSQEYFVFLPAAPPRGCQVRAEFSAGRHFVDVCSGHRYDLAGRALLQPGQPPQANLLVPPYRLTAEGVLEIGIWQPGSQ